MFYSLRKTEHLKEKGLSVDFVFLYGQKIVIIQTTSGSVPRQVLSQNILLMETQHMIQARNKRCFYTNNPYTPPQTVPSPPVNTEQQGCIV